MAKSVSVPAALTKPPSTTKRPSGYWSKPHTESAKNVLLSDNSTPLLRSSVTMPSVPKVVSFVPFGK